jgi:hypothetical protein
MNREVRQVLAELELVSHGKCQSFNASGRPAEGHARPFGDPYPEFIVFRDRFEREGYSDRLLQEARDTLKELRKRQAVRPKGESQADIESRAVLEGAGWDRKTAAVAFGLLPSRLGRVRAMAGRDVESGHPLGVLPSERAQMALRLSQAGWSQQRIAQVLATSQPTVCRLLRVAKVAA